MTQPLPDQGGSIQVTEAMVGRGADAIREVMEAASPDSFRLDSMNKVAEIPLTEVTFESLARAVLSSALDQGRCDFCGQTEGHSKRCSVTRHGLNPKPPYAYRGAVEEAEALREAMTDAMLRLGRGPESHGQAAYLVLEAALRDHPGGQ